MAEAHSTHACEVCGAGFSRKLNKDGSARKTRFNVCSAACRYRLLVGPAPDRKPRTCSVQGCSGLHKAHGYCVKHLRRWERETGRRKDDATPRKRKLGPYNCEHCYQTFYAKRRTEAKFCSRQCAFDRWGIVAEERDALRRIQRANKTGAVRTRSKVKSEASALRRIALAWRLAKGVCHVCGEPYARLRAWQRTCSRACDAEHARRQIELVRKHRKIAKAKRRAISKGAEADNIDPIKVFERDKWRCHICGKKTPRELRGSTHNDAPELEHIVSLADGGSHTWGNVACACRECNGAKGAASFGQLGLGFAV